MNTEHDQTSGRTFIKVSGYVLAAVLLGGYIYIYQTYPFEGAWNDIILSTITALSAAFAAVVATLAFFQYDKDDQPRIVWKNLMAACWLWFLGEVIWGYYYVVFGEVSLSIADVSWVLGFVFFTLALYHQYSLIAPSKKIYYRNVAVGSWIVTLLIPFAIIPFLASEWDVQTYVDFWYPFADLAVGIAGIMLMFKFQGGTLMRPWIGLVVFAFADILYAWAEQSGLYEWSSQNNSLLTLFIDSSYLAAYLILALGFVGHLLLLRYGLTSSD